MSQYYGHFLTSLETYVCTYSCAPNYTLKGRQWTCTCVSRFGRQIIRQEFLSHLTLYETFWAMLGCFDHSFQHRPRSFNPVVDATMNEWMNDAGTMRINWLFHLPQLRFSRKQFKEKWSKSARSTTRISRYKESRNVSISQALRLIGGNPVNFWLWNP